MFRVNFIKKEGKFLKNEAKKFYLDLIIYNYCLYLLICHKCA